MNYINNLINGFKEYIGVHISILTTMYTRFPIHMILLTLLAALYIAMSIIGWFRVFRYLNIKPWKSLIPIYRVYLLSKTITGKFYWFIGFAAVKLVTALVIDRYDTKAPQSIICMLFLAIVYGYLVYKICSYFKVNNIVMIISVLVIPIAYVNYINIPANIAMIALGYYTLSSTTEKVETSTI